MVASTPDRLKTSAVEIAAKRVPATYDELLGTHGDVLGGRAYVTFASLEGLGFGKSAGTDQVVHL